MTLCYLRTDSTIARSQVAVHRSLRKKTRTLKIMSEVACKDVVVKHFNLVCVLS
jgi:hypothetical protein